MAELDLLHTTRFKVVLLPVEASPGTKISTTGAFQECTGLDVEMDVKEHLEGGANDSVVRQVGRAKYSSITLKRGIIRTGPGAANVELWAWIDDILAGRAVQRYRGLVELWDDFESPAATWVFRRGLPQKLTGPQLNAATGAVAIEELQIAHEGLRLVSGRETAS